MKLFQIWGLEWNSATEHAKQEDAQAPYIDKEAFIALVNNDLRSKVSWGPALFLNYLAFLNDFRYSKVAYLDAFLAVEQYVVKLYVPVDY